MLCNFSFSFFASLVMFNDHIFSSLSAVYYGFIVYEYVTCFLDRSELDQSTHWVTQAIQGMCGHSELIRN